MLPKLSNKQLDQIILSLVTVVVVGLFAAAALIIRSVDGYLTFGMWCGGVQ